jgi:hypothetical protein
LKLAAPNTAPTSSTAWTGTITRLTYLGARIEVALRLAGGTDLLAHVVNESLPAWQVGTQVTAWFEAEDAWLVAG